MNFTVIQGFLSIGMLMIKDVYTLINYMSFVEALAVGVSVFGLLWLRYKDPDAERPIKVIKITTLMSTSSICYSVIMKKAFSMKYLRA